MDGLKLEKWKKDFLTGIAHLQIEFDSFFINKPIESYFLLEADAGENLHLQIREGLPEDIKCRIEKLFTDTKPEDSV